jgi:hypothetical protein
MFIRSTCSPGDNNNFFSVAQYTIGRLAHPHLHVNGSKVFQPENIYISKAIMITVHVMTLSYFGETPT